jgi:hypothetical protein
MRTAMCCNLLKRDNELLVTELLETHAPPSVWLFELNPGII